MRKRLTQKQLNFVHEYIKNGGNGVQAAFVAYNTKIYKSASKIADTNLKNPYIQKAIETVLSKKEITLDKIVGVIDDGLNSELVLLDPETKEYHATKFPDYGARHNYLVSTLDLLGLRKSPTKIEEKIYSGVLSVEQIDSIRARM